MMSTKFDPIENQQPTHFTAFIELLVGEFAPMQIYQFAQTLQTESLNSVFCTARRQEQQVYYLLLITADNEPKENRMQQFITTTYTEAKVVVMVHGEDTLLQPNHPCKGFFSRVFNDGQLLYRAAGAIVLDEVRAPNLKKRIGRAMVHWRKRNHMASGFLTAAEEAIDSDHEQVTLFLLNQAIAQACAGLIYVLMGYQSDQRDLKRLLEISACFSKLPLQHFVGTPESEALLNIIIKSCSRTNTPGDFSLEGRSAYRFLDLVDEFLKMTGKLCQAHFAMLQAALVEAKVNVGVDGKQ